MQAFEWEQRDNETPIWLHMVAGSFAGLSQHLSMLPLDNIKTHCQADKNLKYLEIIKSIYQHGGLKNFYSGSSILAMGCIPAHAIYFSIYQQAKKVIGSNNNENHYKYAFVGVASSLFHDLIMTPTQVVKQRLQLIRSQTVGVRVEHVMRQMYKNQGFISFYRSFGINYLMNVPFSSMIVYMNQKLKHVLKVKQGDNHLNYYLCGGLAGALASIPTTPFDVIKTKLNTQACLSNICEKKVVCDILKNKKMSHEKVQNGDPFVKMYMNTEKPTVIKYRTIIDTSVTVFREEGMSGFFAGLRIRMAIQSISSAIAWGTYQIFKSTFNPNKLKH